MQFNFNFIKKASLETDVGLVDRAKKGDSIALNQLINNHRDLLTVQVNKFRRAPVPLSAIEGEAMQIMLDAVKKYDPKSGASFRTYLETSLRGLNRYVNSNKNVARIPENKFLRLRHFMSTDSLLRAQYNRPPTLQELSDELGWSQADVFALQKAVKQKDLTAMDFEEQSRSAQAGSRQHETAQFVYATLNPNEKLVFDYSLGQHGKPVIDDVREIAKKTSLTPDQVYKIRRAISQRILKSN